MGGIDALLAETKQAITDLTFLVLRAMDTTARRELVLTSNRRSGKRLLTRSHAAMYGKDIDAIIAGLKGRLGPGTDAETKRRIEDLIGSAEGLKKIARI